MFNTRPLILAFALFAGLPLSQAAERIEVFKSPYCGGGEKWIEHMRKAGFNVVTKDVNDVPADGRDQAFAKHEPLSPGVSP